MYTDAGTVKIAKDEPRIGRGLEDLYNAIGELSEHITKLNERLNPAIRQVPRIERDRANDPKIAGSPLAERICDIVEKVRIERARVAYILENLDL